MFPTTFVHFDGHTIFHPKATFQRIILDAWLNETAVKEFSAQLTPFAQLVKAGSYVATNCRSRCVFASSFIMHALQLCCTCKPRSTDNNPPPALCSGEHTSATRLMLQYGRRALTHNPCHPRPPRSREDVILKMREMGLRVDGYVWDPAPRCASLPACLLFRPVDAKPACPHRPARALALIH
jgi:hypothetical protein